MFLIVYLKCDDDETKESLLSLQETIVFLTSSATLNIKEEIPSGCAITTISENCEAHLMLKV